LVYNISEEKEQIDSKRNKFIFQFTLTKPKLVQICIKIKEGILTNNLEILTTAIWIKIATPDQVQIL